MAQISRRGFLGTALGATVLGAGAASLSSCSSSASGSGSGSGSVPKTLTFRWWGGDARNTAYKAALDAFTKSTGIKVTPQFSGYDGYFDKLNTEFAAGDPPDLIQMDTNRVSTYATQGVLTDLSQFVPGTIHLDTLYQPLRSGGVVKGKNYGVASGEGYAPVLYNATVLDQFKIAHPKDDWTWSDLSTMATEISKAWGKGHYGVLDASPDDSGALQPWLRQQGADLYDADAKLAFTPDHLTQWFTYWDGLRKAGACCPANLLATAGDASGTHPLIARQVAITTGWGLGQMASLTKDELKLVVVPRGSNGKTGQSLNSGVLLSIPAKSKNPVGAAKLIDLFISNDEVIKTMKLTRGLPPSAKAKDLLLPGLDPAQKEDVTYGEYVAQEVTKDALPLTPAAPPGYGDVKTALDKAAKSVAFGKASIKDAVDQFFTDAKKALNP